MYKLLEEVKKNEGAASADFDTVTTLKDAVIRDVFVIPVYYREKTEGKLGERQRKNFRAIYCPFTGEKLVQ